MAMVSTFVVTASRPGADGGRGGTCEDDLQCAPAGRPFSGATLAAQR